MALSLKQIEEEVLKLDIIERIRLADFINLSIHGYDVDVEKAWIEEAESRAAAYRRGEIATYDSDEVFELVRQRLKR